MTALRAALVAALAVLVLADCGNNPAQPDITPAGTFRVVTVTVDGRDVRCVTWKERNAGGITCDWQGVPR